MLRQCCTHLAANGARELIAYVDADAPPSAVDRSSTAPKALYDASGFTEIDRLHSFTRRV